MERYFPGGRTDLVPFSLGHISRQDLLDKIVKDHDKVAVLNAVNSFMHKTLLAFTIIFFSEMFTWQTQESFSCDESNMPPFLSKDYANQANIHRKFGTTRPQFSRKEDPNVFLEDRQ